MKYVFRISGYDAPGLEAEAAELLHQRLEAYSRKTVPGLWKVTDFLTSRSANDDRWEGRRKAFRFRSISLLFLGVFALVPGLMEPRIPSLTVVGGVAILFGLLGFLLSGAKKASGPPASCRKEAAQLLEQRRETDWEALQAEIRFDEAGMTVSVQGETTAFAYETFRAAFESERLWLVVYEKNMAHLLQKKDLISGEAEDFLPYLQGKIIK